MLTKLKRRMLTQGDILHEGQKVKEEEMKVKNEEFEAEEEEEEVADNSD